MFCRQHVAQLRAHEATFRAAGALLAAVGLGDRRYAQAFRGESGVGFPLLVDERREAYRAAGLGTASPLDVARPSILAAGFRALRAGHRPHRIGEHPMQLGGSFVFGTGGTELFAQVSRDFADNASPAALLAALRA